ncbi:hypothetical protein CS063_16785 [Sporanaerobium hydrogeniformans]|uniref:Uncharacterized protein n=1 Tax=Sporanaerobium hydrogeniformans TaxID=3072179 RepID=A0AC61D7F8_9FIRM|nr:hypothetical protein [Sporanaerobium hydrogeniformans]PHV69243.1 hypothetical protein CS063_16785 [Sporanaerobium hydrogeniformans]
MAINQVVTTVPGVIVLRAAKDKAGQKACAYQNCQITTKCVQSNIQAVDFIVTHGSLKEVEKETIRLFEQKHFKYLLFYSPRQFTSNQNEFIELVEMLEQFYGIYVKQLRP